MSISTFSSAIFLLLISLSQVFQETAMATSWRRGDVCLLSPLLPQDDVSSTHKARGLIVRRSPVDFSRTSSYHRFIRQTKPDQIESDILNTEKEKDNEDVSHVDLLRLKRTFEGHDSDDNELDGRLMRQFEAVPPPKPRPRPKPKVGLLRKILIALNAFAMNVLELTINVVSGLRRLCRKKGKFEYMVWNIGETSGVVLW